jgi:hypothetical protein
MRFEFPTSCVSSNWAFVIATCCRLIKKGRAKGRDYVSHDKLGKNGVK